MVTQRGQLLSAGTLQPVLTCQADLGAATPNPLQSACDEYQANLVN